MVTDMDQLLHDVLALMQQLLKLPQLPVETQMAVRGLVTRLEQAGHTDGAYRPSYLDMKGTMSLRKLHHAMDAKLLAGVEAADTAANGWLWARSPSKGLEDDKEDSGDQDTSAGCSECLEDAVDTVDDWPPRGAPSCPRPDLSPDWAVSAVDGRGRALHCGPVFRPSRGAGRWFRVRRRGWAALLSAPARLLVFSGPSSSRPRLVLPLALVPTSPTVPTAPAAPTAPTAPCCDPCCGLYTARLRPQTPAFELCCPGRKTHQLWVSDEAEAQSWVDALRRAAQGGASGGPWPSPSCDPVAATPLGTPANCYTNDPAPSASDTVDTSTSTSLRSRSRSESRSTSVLSIQQRTSASVDLQTATLEENSGQPIPASLPSPTAADAADHQQQQDYESMLTASEEIYHDIALPDMDEGGPNYANVLAVSTPLSSSDGPVEDAQTRPLYDDVASPPKPLYSNLNLQPGNDLDEAGHGEHLYDDIGHHNVTETRASVYELIQDPVISQGIRCS